MNDIQLATVQAEQQKRHNPRTIIYTGLGVIALFFGAFALWATLTPLHGAVQAMADVIFDSRRKTVQHLEGGIVKQILVKEGETVTAGQPLIILADEQIRPMVEMMEGQSLAETAALARLEAEKGDFPSISFPASLTSKAGDPVVARVIQTETRLFNAKRDSYNSQIAITKSQIQQVQEETNGLKEQLASKKKEIAALTEQLSANRDLLKDGYVTKTIVLDLERAHARESGELEGLTSAIARNKQRLAEYELRLIAIKGARIQDAANEMKVSTAKRLELEERIRPSKNALDRQVIRAPVSGRVVDLKVTTAGGVIGNKEPLMDIVPQSDQLILEARIGVNDINDVKIGQTADITLTAYKASSTPTVKAKVTYIAADRQVNRTMQGDLPFYTVRLEVDPVSMKEGGDLKLYPGMMAQVSIQTSPRTAFDYFVGPLTQRMGKAFHEK
ncbi:MAG TPA: HlyD family type I secretion periplasmic adaptor subunit [Desulfuromonadales bacterium]|nr:HlyD family type I secretion periplasmic adaptor subunit [Desulfuromonadales bacterium]